MCVDYLWTFYSLGRSRPEEINQGEEEAIRPDFAARVFEEQKELTGPRACSPAQEEDKDVNRGRRREEGEGNQECESLQLSCHSAKFGTNI